MYVETTLRVVWAPTKPVYRNVDMDMYLFFLIYEGWSIGTLDMVNSAVYFHGGKVVKKGNECAYMHAYCKWKIKMVILLKAAQKLRNLGRHNGTARRKEYGRITLPRI